MSTSCLKKKGKKLMGLKLGTGGRMVFRRDAPDSAMNCNTDIRQIYLCQFRPLKQK